MLEQALCVFERAGASIRECFFERECLALSLSNLRISSTKRSRVVYIFLRSSYRDLNTSSSLNSLFWPLPFCDIDLLVCHTYTHTHTHTHTPFVSNMFAFATYALTVAVAVTVLTPTAGSPSFCGDGKFKCHCLLPLCVPSTMCSSSTRARMWAGPNTRAHTRTTATVLQPKLHD